MTLSLVDTADRTVLDAVVGLPAIGLSAVNERAALLQREDVKFIVWPSAVARLLDSVPDDFVVLEIDGRRQFTYESTYFDSPRWQTFRAHAQGRRRRYKVRTRRYVETDTCMFEVKLEGLHAGTTKCRIPHEISAAGRLTESALRALGSILDAHRLPRLEDPTPALTSTYRRVTLASRTRAVRITLDTSLEATTWAGSTRAFEDRVLLEVKTPGGRDEVLTRLARLGHRPVSVSKYCAAVAALHHELPGAAWRDIIRRHFTVDA